MESFQTRLSAATWLFTVTTILYGLGVIIYRLYFHPLSKIPGPKLFTISGFTWGVDNQVRGLFAKRVLKFHQKYGDIVRTGPNRISIDGAIGWPEVFGHGRGNQPEFAHWNDFYQFGGEPTPSIFACDRESHRRQRRLMAHAFSDAAMYEQEVLINKYVDLLFDRLREQAVQEKPVDILKWYNYTTFDIIGDLAFAEPFHCLENSGYHPWVAMIFDSIRAGARMNFLQQFPFFMAFLRLTASKEDMRKREESRTMASEKAERRVALGPAPGDRKDIMTYILRHNDEKGMSHREILGNSETLIVAGSETTATALSGLTYYITTNPQAFKLLKDEIRTTFSSEAEITMRSTARLVYLNACIEEAMRVYPPAAETPPRISPGATVNGYYIPKGTFITVHQWANHHNPINFTQPDDFIPERWLGPDHPLYDPRFSNDRKSTFQPFSYGPRNCIGKNLAYAEIRLIAARLFWNFDFELQPGYENWPDKHRIFVAWEKTPLMVQLKLAERGSV